MDTSAYDEHNVVATFGDMGQAREAVAALENRGVDGGRIALEGANAERAASRPDTAGRDDALLEKGRNTAVMGILIGAIVGGALGYLAAGLMFGFPSDDGGSVGMTLAMTLGLGTAGAGVGLAIGGYSRIKQSDAWEATYDAEPGPVQVGVHTPVESERDVAVAVFERHGATGIEHYDRDGRRVTTS